MKSCEEWSYEFDLMYNNIASDKSPGLDEYEKSIFLTRAEKSIVLMLYKGTIGPSFEATEEVSSYLDSLVKQQIVEPSYDVDESKLLSPNSVVFKNPSDLLFRTVELCTISLGDCEKEVIVEPVTQDEYWRTIRNPFKRYNKNRALRLCSVMSDTTSSDDNKGYVEIVSNYEVEKYKVRYLSSPSPIILADLDDGHSIDGETEAMTCTLPETLHPLILAEAVRMAKAAWT